MPRIKCQNFIWPVAPGFFCFSSQSFGGFHNLLKLYHNREGKKKSRFHFSYETGRVSMLWPR